MQNGFSTPAPAGPPPPPSPAPPSLSDLADASARDRADPSQRAVLGFNVSVILYSVYRRAHLRDPRRACWTWTFSRHPGTDLVVHHPDGRARGADAAAYLLADLVRDALDESLDMFMNPPDGSGSGAIQTMPTVRKVGAVIRRALGIRPRAGGLGTDDDSFVPRLAAMCRRYLVQCAAAAAAGVARASLNVAPRAGARFDDVPDVAVPCILAPAAAGDGRLVFAPVSAEYDPYKFHVAPAPGTSSAASSAESTPAVHRGGRSAVAAAALADPRAVAPILAALASKDANGHSGGGGTAAAVAPAGIKRKFRDPAPCSDTDAHGAVKRARHDTAAMTPLPPLSGSEALSRSHSSARLQVLTQPATAPRNVGGDDVGRLPTPTTPASPSERITVSENRSDAANTRGQKRTGDVAPLRATSNREPSSDTADPTSPSRRRSSRLRARSADGASSAPGSPPGIVVDMTGDDDDDESASATASATRDSPSGRSWSTGRRRPRRPVALSTTTQLTFSTYARDTVGDMEHANDQSPSMAVKVFRGLQIMRTTSLPTVVPQLNRYNSSPLLPPVEPASMRFTSLRTDSGAAVADSPVSEPPQSLLRKLLLAPAVVDRGRDMDVVSDAPPSPPPHVRLPEPKIQLPPAEVPLAEVPLAAEPGSEPMDWESTADVPLTAARDAAFEEPTTMAITTHVSAPGASPTPSETAATSYLLDPPRGALNRRKKASYLTLFSPETPPAPTADPDQALPLDGTPVLDTPLLKAYFDLFQALGKDPALLDAVDQCVALMSTGHVSDTAAMVDFARECIVAGDDARMPPTKDVAAMRFGVWHVLGMPRGDPGAWHTVRAAVKVGEGRMGRAW
ncbi:hypothetical protein AMAG_19453 [Allomyces macrogynus ATCC 38327]|uniref:Uncharacterized protein n=1 Tax=Allomyces macrogynus (strain ATCC 38327) TaxID=578462 RepID=A0A0L0SS91_ALLM3|nr:hypothetical protein AMAG_19453 [Allomyces macrogynus ATCC 38327]|eukprot:KNE65361.1 hypothetical protein AMAG_19453 [Allomyces macrogynus ATCC 38327]